MEEPAWLDPTLLEVLHADQINEHGGRVGVRDPGLLDSALARPLHRWAYEQAADVAALAAAYGYGVAKNHPFIDGNKRTALMTIYTFLGINGFELDAPEPEAVTAMLTVADGSLTQDELAHWIRSRLIPWEE